MADSAQVLQILLRVQADVAELQGKLNPALDSTKAKLDEIGGAGKDAAGSLGEMGTILGSGFGVAGGVVLALGAVVATMAQIPGEIARINSEIIDQEAAVQNAISEWQHLAQTAKDFGDQVKLSGKIATDLQLAEARYETFRTTQLTYWQMFAENVGRLLKAAIMPPLAPLQWMGLGGGAITDANAAATASARAGSIAEIQAQNDAIQRSNQNISVSIADIPLLEAKIRGLTNARDEQSQILDIIAAKGKAVTDQEIHAASNAALEYARLDEQLGVTRDQLEQVQRERDKEGRSDAAARARAEAAARRELNQSLAAERLQLEAITATMANIAQNPFLTLGEKNTALTQEIPAAIARLNQLIVQNRSQLTGSILDPAQYNAVQGAIQRDEQAVIRLRQQLQLASSPLAQFRASLVQWVNSFGTVAQQAGNLITSTLGTAVNGISNAITGLIFKTTTWGQAFAQIAQSIVGNLIQIGLQLIASQLAAFIIRITLGEASLAAAAVEGQALAAIYAPAAVAASIATEGGAAIAGQTAFTASLLSGQAFAVALAAFAAGGPTPGKPTLAVVGEQGPEFVFSAAATQRAGIANLTAFHNELSRPSSPSSGAVSLGGGSVGGKSARPTIHEHLIFLDPNELAKHLAKTTAQQTSIVNVSNRRGGRLRT